MLMTTRTEPPVGKVKRPRGRPPLAVSKAVTARRTTLNFTTEEAARIDVWRAAIKKEIPIDLTEPALVKLLFMRALEAFERQQAQPQLALQESSTTKQNP